MERVMTVTEILADFDALIQAVAEGQEVIVVENDGKPQVAILSVAEYERLRPTRSDNWLAEHMLAFLLREYPVNYRRHSGPHALERDGSICRLPTDD